MEATDADNHGNRKCLICPQHLSGQIRRPIKTNFGFPDPTCCRPLQDAAARDIIRPARVWIAGHIS
jgi:hypothetical protein